MWWDFGINCFNFSAFDSFKPFNVKDPSMKDAQDYIKEISSEIDELLHSGNGLEESAIAVQTKHIAALEEKVNQLCTIREMPMVV